MLLVVIVLIIPENKTKVDDEKTNRFDTFIGYKYSKYKVEYDYTQMYN